MAYEPCKRCDRTVTPSEAPVILSGAPNGAQSKDAQSKRARKQ
jgi:hypothetical protein